MSKISQLSSVNLRQLQEASASKRVERTTQGKDFGDTIADFVKAVNETQKKSAREIADVIQGRSENLHQAMAMLEEAHLSFQLMIEIRNKLLESYQELQRMQV